MMENDLTLIREEWWAHRVHLSDADSHTIGILLAEIDRLRAQFDAPAGMLNEAGDEEDSYDDYPDYVNPYWGDDEEDESQSLTSSDDPDEIPF